MENHTKSKKPEQSKNSFKEELEALRNDNATELIRIHNEIIELGHTPDTFLTAYPDIDTDPEKAEQLLVLQKQYREVVEQKNRLENTIFIEPSKLHENVQQAEQLLIRHSDRNIYQRAGKIVRLITASSLSQKKVLVKRAWDAIVIKEIDHIYLIILLTELGNFIRLDGRSGAINAIACPEKIACGLIAKQEWKLPDLLGIINTPTLRIDGSILDTPGYDAISGMLFVPGDCIFEKIPEYPTLQEVEDSKNLLLDILKGFPFEDEVARSVAFAAILTALIRKSIPTAPLFGFSAPKMASGKSLLADSAALLATGKPNSAISYIGREEEEKKRLLAILIEGDPIVCFDNIEKPFGGATLCAILTQREYKDRLLGHSETRTVLTNTLFLATGNNLTFTGDMSTRALLCKLDPKVERPEERSFDVNLHQFIPHNRGRLVRAGLIILRAYYVAGKPKQNIQPFGRFDDWSDWIRSAIIWIGMADPCESRKEIENADPVRMMLGSLFCSWHAIFTEDSIRVKDLVAAAFSANQDEMHEMLRESLLELAPDRKEGVNQRSLAMKLSSYKNRIEQGFRLEKMGAYQGTHLWRVIQIKTNN